MESKKEILEFTIDQLIYRALLEMEQNDSRAKLSAKKMADACDALIDNNSESLETQQRLDEYVGQLCEVSAEQFQYLYVQGAKDCVALLQKLGVI